MSDARYIIGDTREVLRTLPDASVDTICTSPPFLALRSYLPADHPDKGKEIGSESNPGAFLDVLLDVVVELRRVLAPHGSLCVELGDTYSGSGGAGGDYADGGMREGQPQFRAGTPRWDGRPEGQVRTTTSDPVTYPPRARGGWPEPKSLCLVPSSFAWALSYGRNPWTGRELEPWRVRNLIAWCRPNPPVGALGDKFRPATSYMTVACKGGKRYFDLDAVRDPDCVSGTDYEKRAVKDAGRDDGWGRATSGRKPNPAGAPPLDYWVIPTHPYPGSHYATYPPELCVKPIKAMCPERVCRVCGKPSERIVGKTPEYEAFRASRSHKAEDHTDATVARHIASKGGVGSLDNGEDYGARGQLYETLGWTDCGHDDWRRGVVLDPFAGSGTTLAVATGHGRDAIGIDLDPRNADLARERIGMFLAVT